MMDGSLSYAAIGVVLAVTDLALVILMFFARNTREDIKEVRHETNSLKNNIVLPSQLNAVKSELNDDIRELREMHSKSVTELRQEITGMGNRIVSDLQKFIDVKFEAIKLLVESNQKIKQQ